jgi:hypothetical protein
LLIDWGKGNSRLLKTDSIQCPSFRILLPPFYPSLHTVPLAQPIDKLIIDFFQTDFQIPLMEDGTTVSGLWLTAAVIFLLFIASISLVIACISPGAPSPTAAPTAAPAPKASKEAAGNESKKQK